MNHEEMMKIAWNGYCDEMQKLAIQSYFGDNYEDFTKESADAIVWMRTNMAPEEREAMDKMASEIMEMSPVDMVKAASIIGAIGRGFNQARVWAGSKLVGGGVRGLAASAERAAKPSAQFSKFLAGRGRSPAFIQQSHKQMQRAGGPAGYIRTRRLEEVAMRGVKGTGRSAGLPGAPAAPAPAAAAAAPGVATTVKPPAKAPAKAPAGPSSNGKAPTGTKPPGEAAVDTTAGKEQIMAALKDLKGGAIAGLGFGAAFSMLAPKADPEYRLAG